MGNASAGKSKLRAVGGEASPRWDEDALGFLIAPVTREAFLERYYERDALINNRGEPDRYADLLTLDMLDHFIASANLREGMVDLANQQEPHRPRHLYRRPRPDQLGRHRRGISARRDRHPAAPPQIDVQPRRVLPVAGGSLLLPHPDQHLPDPAVSSDGTSNQGFPPHYDNHDVFVMQISGTKGWRLYGVPVETPFRGEEFQLGRHEAGEVTQSSR